MRFAQDMACGTKNAGGTVHTWKDELAKRLRTLWLFKMLSTTIGIAGFFYAYFWVMRHPLSAMTAMPVTWMDELVVFWPQSFLLYISLWVYVGLGTALTKDLRELAAFGAASLAMIVLGLGIFMIAPTKVSGLPIDWSRYPSLAFLKRVDVAGNACPSLHAAFAVFTGFVIHGHLTAIGAARALRVCNVLWCLGILYSTVATRQHVALDVIAGSVLAGAASIVYVRAGRIKSARFRHLASGS
jgi:hypothetical protein